MNRKSKEEVLEAIRLAANSIDNKPLSQTECWKNSDITITDIYRYFPKWSDACIAAGVMYDSSRDKVPDIELLSEWGSVTRELGHIPSLTEYKVKGGHSRNTFDRFGKWIDIPEVFRKYFNGSNEWKDVLELLEEHSNKPKKKVITTELKVNYRSSGHFHPKRADRPIFGDPIDFRGLRHEPVNEQGVVFLFGMVARELDYLVEAIQGGFPDCEAKRKISKGQWQPVQIEFEYESKNFVDHGHDPKKCDVIVCWIHNWAECPENLEILVLSEEIKTLKSRI